MGIFRFVLALAVLIQHGGPLFGLQLVGGRLAVQTFFIISGFYMTLILDGKYAKLRRPYFVFIGNRLLRLFPAYLVVLFLTLVSSLLVLRLTGVQVTTRWGGLSEWMSHGSGLNFSARLLLVLTNLVMLGQDWILYTIYQPNSGALHFVSHPFKAAIPGYRFLLVPQAWTLGIELSFYLVAPFLVRRSWWKVALVLVASLILRTITYYRFHLTFDPWTYRFFPQELALFLAGCLGCKLYESFFRNHPRVSKWMGSAGLGLLLLIAVSYSWISFQNKHTVYLILTALFIPAIFALSRNWRWDRNLGELSYPIYISHVLLLPYVDLATERWPYFSRPVLLFLGTVLLAVAIHVLLERRIDGIRQRRVAQSAT